MCTAQVTARIGWTKDHDQKYTKQVGVVALPLSVYVHNDHRVFCFYRSFFIIIIIVLCITLRSFFNAGTLVFLLLLSSSSSFLDRRDRKKQKPHLCILAYTSICVYEYMHAALDRARGQWTYCQGHKIIWFILIFAHILGCLYTTGRWALTIVRVQIDHIICMQKNFCIYKCLLRIFFLLLLACMNAVRTRLVCRLRRRVAGEENIIM